MQTVSAAFRAAMGDTPYIARLTLDGVDIIQGDAIQKINISGGSCDSDNAISLGGAVAGSVQIVLDKKQVKCAVEGRKLFLEFGIRLYSGIEYLPMGTYFVTDPVEDDGKLTVTACDALSAKFDVEYEPIEGFHFETGNGVDSLEFLRALCARRGVEVDTDGLESFLLKSSPEGYTERQIIGFISALYGGNANIDRNGVIRIHWYEAADLQVNADNYYADGMEKASYDFTVEWLKCYVEPMGETLILGDETAPQGIYFDCPWMDEGRLEDIWQKVRGFAYRPVSALKFFGDPRLDPWDIITLRDYGGAEHSVPVMITGHEWDGGIITKLTASGQEKVSAYEGPVKREQKRLYSRILKKQNEIELSIRNIDGDKIISLINLSDTQATIQAPKIKFEGLVTANSNFKILEDGSIEAANAVISGKITTHDITATGGTIGGCKITNGVLEVPAANITGTFTVKDSQGNTLLAAGNRAVQIGGWLVDNNSFYSGDSFDTAECFFCTGSNGEFNIAGSEYISGWMLKAGESFGVTKTGALYANDAHIQGEIVATSGSFIGTVTAEDGEIGGWSIGEVGVTTSLGAEVYSGRALYSGKFYENGIQTEVYLTPTYVIVDRRLSTGRDLDYVTWKEILVAVRNAT